MKKQMFPDISSADYETKTKELFQKGNLLAGKQEGHLISSIITFNLKERYFKR